MKLYTGVLLILTCFAFNSCAVTKRPHELFKSVNVLKNTPRWGAIVTDPSPDCPILKCERILVMAKTNADMEVAMRELCHVKGYICIGPELAAQVFAIDRHRK